MPKSGGFRPRLGKRLSESAEVFDRLKQLIEYVLNLLNLARDTQSNKQSIVELRREIDELAGAVERLSFEVRSVRDEDRHERDKLLLRLENALLRMERQLPPGKEPKKLK